MADKHVSDVLDAVIAESLQDQRALQRTAQQSAQKYQDLVWSNAAALQHQASLMALQRSADNAGVEAAYRGSHLKKGSEIDSQEATAEGVAYKGEAAASFPQTQELVGSSLVSLEKKLDNLVASFMQVVKAAQSTPPQSGGHAAQPPADRAE